MDVKEFFDRLAEHWDDDYVPAAPERIAAAFFAQVAGARVLDVACGTGAMFPELLAAGAAEITGVDISTEMAKRAAQKYAADSRIKVLCGDVTKLPLSGFDSALIYNAYPHFMRKELLIDAMARALKPGGRLTLAHGAGRDIINNHHSGVPHSVKTPLRAASVEAEVWKGLFEVDAIVDTPFFYLISGTRL
ncbi:MAG: class I SAM-dependent methyltransferase [Oscillospiraceae bacterium]|nr:class I SAM-dependent methyltransferase [Oscillospiraceae bacterium]